MSSSVLPFSAVRTRVQSDVLPLPALRAVKLLDRLRERIRLMHYSQRTEESYVYWCRAFIRFHGVRHPAEMGHEEVEAFLTHLAVQRQVAISTHRQALSALLFLYGKGAGGPIALDGGDRSPGAQTAIASGADA